MEANYCFSCMSLLENDVCPNCEDPDTENLPGQLRCGTLLEDRYLIGRSIGQGGFGITYIGRDLRLDKIVAIKEYYPMSLVRRSSELSDTVETFAPDQSALFAEGKGKFLQEARLLARFNNDPNIVYVNDFFEENSTAYMVMEYLKGRSFSELLKSEGPMGLERVLPLFAPLIDTLEDLHSGGLLHRDISPSNIMLTEGGRVKLLDFGSARQTGQSGGNMTVFSKAGYTPTEQYSEGGEQGPWTDVYSLCATIYKLITGITPDSSLMRAYKETLVPPSELGIAISPRQETALLHGLVVNHQARTRSMAQLKAELFAPELDDEATVVGPEFRSDISSDVEVTATGFEPQPTANVPPVSGFKPQPKIPAIKPEPVPVIPVTFEQKKDSGAEVNKKNISSRSNKTPNYKAEKKSGSKKKKPWLIPVLAAAAVFVVLVIIIGVKSQPVDNWFANETVTVRQIRKLRSSSKTTYVYFNDCVVSDDVLKALSECRYIQSVHINRCTGFSSLYLLGFMKNLDSLYISGDQQTATEISLMLSGESIPDFQKVEYLSLQGEYLSTADFLYHFPALTSLEINTCGGTPDNVDAISSLYSLDVLSITNWDISAADLGALSDLPALERLTLSNCGVSDISWISSLEKLYSVQLPNDPVTDISPLAGLTKLTVLNLNNDKIIDPSIIAGMEKMRSLWLDETGIDDLDFCLGMVDLDSISAARNSLVSIDGLANCSVLKYVNLNDNDLSDLSLLSKSAAALNTVRVNNNRITDLKWLEGAISLKRLSASGNVLTDLSGLESSNELITLSVFNNSISDISAISGHLAIKDLDLGENDLEDISALSGMTELDNLILQNNRIRDMSPISLPESSFALVSLFGNDFETCPVFTTYTAARYLYIDYSESLDLDTILSNTYILYLIDVPLDHRGILNENSTIIAKTAFGTFHYFSTEDALNDIAARRAEIEDKYSS